MRIFAVDWPGPGKLSIVTRPTPDDIRRELEALKTAGVQTLVSLLGEAEAWDIGLAGEGDACERAGLRFVSHPVPDFALPDRDRFRALLFELHDRFRDGESIAAHCRGSVGRAPLLIASLLVLDGAEPDDAWARVSRARGVPVPDTAAQRQWIRHLEARR